MQIVLFIIIAYLLYRFITGFVLPLATTASRIKKQFREMQANQPRNNEAPDNGQPSAASAAFEKQRTTSGKKAPKEDYIDFEEIPPNKRY